MIKHSEEFKQEAVRIALTSGLPRDRVAADLGIGKYIGHRLRLRVSYCSLGHDPILVILPYR
jgi:transposase-like protein